MNERFLSQDHVTPSTYAVNQSGTQLSEGRQQEFQKYFA
jgi:hypothetical protein